MALLASVATRSATALVDRVIALAGGPDALSVIIPTAWDRMPPRLPSGDVEPRRIKDLRSAFESRGARRVVFPHTRHRQVANSEELVKVLHSANAVFLPGGASTITTFGTPRDVTIDELRIEGTFPADEATAQFCRTLA